MIKNERQYRITKAQADKFERALKWMPNEKDASNNLHPLLQQAQKDALVSQFADLEAELADYDALRSGERKVFELTSFDEFPRALIQARIALGLSHKDLADKLGIKEQQLQRYEATDYSSASIERVKQVVSALGLSVREDVFLPDVEISAKKLFRRLKEAGLDKDFVLTKVLPPSIAAHLQMVDKHKEPNTFVLQAATRISRIFKYSVASLFGDAPLPQLESSAHGTVRFKVKAGANERRLSAYTFYAIYLSHLTLDATVDLPSKTVPTNAAEFRRAVVKQFGSVSFENVLKFYWSLGVPVLPLRDSGAFHGACIRREGRNVIVLKQQTSSFAKWLNDTLHEGFHAGQEPEKKERETIEYSETSKERRESPEEKMAFRFAGDVELDGRAEELTGMCVRAAGSFIDKLKRKILEIAARENVSSDALANYIAFRLSLEGDNRFWGVAANLQKQGEPWKFARDLFLRNVNLGSLNEIDRNFLEQAMSDVEA